MRRRRLFLPLAAGAVLWLALQAGAPAPPAPPAPAPLRIGEPAPDFELPLLRDAAGRLASGSLRGRVWLLNVWASWCAPCREEHPLLLRLAAEGTVPIVGLAMHDDPRSADEWLRKLGDPYVAAASDADGTVGARLGVRGVPETFVIDAAGTVRWRHAGPLTAALWQAEVLPLLRRLRG